MPKLKICRIDFSLEGSVENMQFTFTPGGSIKSHGYDEFSIEELHALHLCGVEIVDGITSIENKANRHLEGEKV